jgi:hypothetical protein
MMRKSIYFDDRERTKKEGEARHSQTRTHADAYTPGGNKRKAKEKNEAVNRILRQ